MTNLPRVVAGRRLKPRWGLAAAVGWVRGWGALGKGGVAGEEHPLRCYRGGDSWCLGLKRPQTSQGCGGRGGGGVVV